MCSLMRDSTVLRRHLDRVLDRARRRLAVRDHADAAHAEQRRAAVLGVVEVLERLHERFRLETGVRLQHRDHHRRDRLVELEHDVANEAVADDDVDRPAIAAAGREVAPFDVALEVHAGGSEELVGFLDDRVALLRLPRRC